MRLKNLDLNEYINIKVNDTIIYSKKKHNQPQNTSFIWIIIIYRQNIKTNIIGEFKEIFMNCFDNNSNLNKNINSKSIRFVYSASQNITSIINWINKVNLKNFYENVNNISLNIKNGSNTNTQNNINYNNNQCRDYSSRYAKNNRC